MKKIVAVDDDPDLLFTLRTILDCSDKEYEVTTFDCGSRCMEYLKKETPDLILSDLMMPEMNGWELKINISRIPELKNVPFIFISAVGDDTSKITAELQSDGFIEKPFTAEVILNKIEKIFNKQRQ